MPPLGCSTFRLGCGGCGGCGGGDVNSAQRRKDVHHELLCWADFTLPPRHRSLQDELPRGHSYHQHLACLLAYAGAVCLALSCLVCVPALVRAHHAHTHTKLHSCVLAFVHPCIRPRTHANNVLRTRTHRTGTATRRASRGSRGLDTMRSRRCRQRTRMGRA